MVRPVREQLEHDRVIRLLQAKLKRKHDVATNIGDEQAAPIKVGPGQMFPDLVLTSQDKAHKLEGIVEVETGESVNHLEAMAQWAHFGRVRAPFYLYVPAGAVDIARRLCIENNVEVTEIWSFHSMGDQTRFTLVQRSSTPAPPPAKSDRPSPAKLPVKAEKADKKKPVAPAAKPAPKNHKPKPKAKPATVAKPAKALKTTKATKPGKAAKATKAKRK